MATLSRMAANLTPQYLEAESEYKKAQSAEERLEALRKMLTLVPKHKASEKLQAELKTKISEAREACDRTLDFRRSRTALTSRNARAAARSSRRRC